MASKKVIVDCPHCGEHKYDVDDSMAVAGVPDTHVQAAISDHEKSTRHFMSGATMFDFPGFKPREDAPKVTGRIVDFEHGKEHNA